MWMRMGAKVSPWVMCISPRFIISSTAMKVTTTSMRVGASLSSSRKDRCCFSMSFLRMSPDRSRTV